MATPPQERIASNISSNNEKKMAGILPNTVVENKPQQEDDEEHKHSSKEEEAMSLEEIDRLLGRSAEESILLNSYFACLSTNQKSLATVILIHGDSGLGKSKLAETLRTHVIEDDGYFIKGKFEQLSYGSTVQPYRGIDSAFAEYCAALVQRGEDELGEITNKVQRQMKEDERELLCNAIPSLRKIMLNTSCHLKKETDQRLCSEINKLHNIKEEEKESVDIYSESHRLISLIKKFTTIISSIGDPIVLVLDDVQWASKTDLDVLKSMYLGAKNPFLFVFTCRPIDEQDHPFLTLADNFQSKTEIDLKKLRQKSVHELVAALLGLQNPKECASLANFVSYVADGNPFFVHQQLISLRKEGHLRNVNSEWVWNLDEVGASGGALGNINLLLTERMKKLPTLTQEALKICACIGPTDLYVLGLLIHSAGYCKNHYGRFVGNGVEPKGEDKNSLARKAVSIAVQEGFLVMTKNGVVFTHDRVKEAAYSLIPPKQRSLYHLKLGKILHINICPELQQNYSYTIAAQLARGIEPLADVDDRLNMASLFLCIGEKSMSTSGFAEAHFFFAKGISLLQEEQWKTHYRLCCDIYTKGADTAALTADYESMDKYLSVLKTKSDSVDFLNASYIQVRSMSARQDPKSFQVCLAALKMAGIKFPSHNILMHTIFNLIKIRLSMKSLNLLHLPPIRDKKVAAVLRLLNVATTLSITWGQKLLPLMSFKTIQLTLTHGTSSALPGAVASYGAILQRLGYSLPESIKYAQYALNLQDKREKLSPHKDDISNLNWLTYGVTLTMIMKPSECIPELFLGVESGLRSGATTHAGSCASAIGYVSFYSGIALSKVAKSLQKLKISMSDYSMQRAMKTNQMHQNAVEYCRGVGESSVCFYDGSETKDLLTFLQSKMLELVVQIIFHKYDLAWQIAEKQVKNYEKVFTGTFCSYVCTFFRGMSSIAILHTSNNKQAVRVVKACIKRLKHIVSDRKKCEGSYCSFSNKLYLLEAEWSVLNGDHIAAEQYYLLSVEHASRASITHEHAYACERYGAYLLSLNNEDASYECIQEAHKLYSKWGAPRKCEMLKGQYPRLKELLDKNQ